MRVAARWAGWSGRLRNVPGPQRGASTAGVPFLAAQLGPLARLVVEVAWGAAAGGDPDTWAWTDITTDVRDEPGISIATGRADEASVSQPAEATMVLDNTAGRYSLGGQSANWPNVRRDVPVRVRVDPNGSNPTVVFQGFAVGFTPSWDVSGRVTEVELQAAGTLRRLEQGTTPVQSSIRRALTTAPTVVAYWPCEDGKNAQSIASASPAPPMTVTGSPSFGSDSSFDCSADLPTLKKATFTGIVPSYTSPTTAQQVRFLAAFPAASEPDNSVICRIYTTGAAVRWELWYRTGGLLALHAFDRNNVQLLDSGAIGFNVNGTPARFSIELVQNGGNVDWWISTIAPFTTGGYFASTLAGTTCGIMTRVEINPGRVLGDVAVGHISVENVRTSMLDVLFQLDANIGEPATARMRRLCRENLVVLNQVGTPALAVSTALMGVQPVATLLDLLRECETADQGVLFDGLGPGLIYVCRDYRENTSALLTVAAGAGQLAPPFAPAHDDQRTRNKVTATRDGGAKATYEQTSGELGTTSAGIYDSSVTVSLSSDLKVPDYASWLVHLGTLAGYRYPGVSLDLRATPTLAAGWLAAIPSTRLDVTGPDGALTAHPGDPVTLIVEGTAQELSPYVWTATAKCGPARPWRIVVLAADTGDTDPNLLHLDTDGSALVAAAAAGATSLSVATGSGPLWTTSADDFPFEITVGGVRVTVTAISGAASPQTFTITPLPLARVGGVPVAVWFQPALRL